MSEQSPEKDVLNVVCPFCSASSNEPCWSDRRATERGPHKARRVLADIMAARVFPPTKP